MIRAGLLGLVVLLPVSASAENTIGRVTSVRGAVALHNSEFGTSLEATLGQRLYRADVVETGEGAAVRLVMADGSVLDIGPKARVSLGNYSSKKKEKKVTLRVFAGVLWARVTAVFGASEYRCPGTGVHSDHRDAGWSQCFDCAHFFQGADQTDLFRISQ